MVQLADPARVTALAPEGQTVAWTPDPAGGVLGHAVPSGHGVHASAPGPDMVPAAHCRL